MAERLALLCVDILAERRVKVGSLEIVRGQRVAGEHGVRIAARNNLGKCISCVAVKGERGSHHPYNIAVVLFIAEQIVDLVIISRERGLAGAALAEREGIVMCSTLAEAVRVQVDALLAVLRASADHLISLF